MSWSGTFPLRSRARGEGRGGRAVPGLARDAGFAGAAGLSQGTTLANPCHNRRVLHNLKIIVLLLLVALVPARAIGSVTISICATGQEQAGAMQHADAGDNDLHADGASHDRHGHRDNQAPGEDSGHACTYCAAHCAGVAFAVPTDLSRVAPAAGSDRIPFGSWSEPGYFPDHLDRPPLVS